MKHLIITACLLFVSLASIAQFTFLGKKTYTADLSDVWGYVDENGNEYALVGKYDGISVVDVTNPATPVEVFSTPGANSIWRDLKTYGDYAYITNESSGGVAIIDLSPLPQSTTLPVTSFTAGGLNSAHNLYIDENGIMYIFGANLGNGGVRMYDLNSNPTNPPLVGTFDTWYVHDGMARGDTLYLGHINDGFFSIVNVANKANPVVLGTHATPSNFTHNVWVSDDGDYLYTTDEVSGAFLGAYNISNPGNIFETDRIRSSPGSGVIPHNAHFINGYLVTSYYRDGLTVHDVNRPQNMVSIGGYDSSPLAGNGFNGAWGAYPWLPSGNILITDIEEGLFIIGANYFRASYLEGMVTDSVCGTALNGVTVSFTSVSGVTDLVGEYKVGTPNAGIYSVTFSAPGYNSKTIPNVTLSAGIVTNLNVTLYSPGSVAINGSTSDGTQPLEGVQAVMAGTSSSYNFTSDSAGNFSRCNVIQGTYELSAGKWGYNTVCQPQQISGAVNTVSLTLSPGYYDDFTFDFGWSVTGNASAGIWERAVPNGTTYFGTDANPGADVSGDCSTRAFVTGNSGTSAGDDDVDGGITILTSPVFDLTGYTNPSVAYHRWFYNSGGNTPADDTLIVRISNGITTRVLERVTAASAGNSSWVRKQFLVSDYLLPTANMTITFVAGDYNQGHLVEAGVDQFEVIESTGIEEEVVANLHVFPNPSANFFKMIPAISGTLTITDLAGKEAGRLSVEAGVPVQFGENLGAGVYIIVLSGENSPLISGRIIKTSR